MARLNRSKLRGALGIAPRTYEGGKAWNLSAELELRRSVLACLLWEDQFYEDGVEIAGRISKLVPKVEAEKVAALAVEARERMKLRHAPLLLVREMARHKSHRELVAKTLERVIQRADELSEFVAIYWKDGKAPLSAQVKKGLAAGFCKFDEYQLAKYDREQPVRLRDVLFLCHAKPRDEEQEALWKRLVDGTLPTPDTWEVALSATREQSKSAALQWLLAEEQLGSLPLVHNLWELAISMLQARKKREAWERLLAEQKLGALALLRNLRNMHQVGVEPKLVLEALGRMKTDRVLPFRFIAAARQVPQWEEVLEKVMLSSVSTQEKLPGHTVLLVDVSGSMMDRLSSRSEMRRTDAAYGLAVLLREIAREVSVYSFSNGLVRVPARRGFALRDAIDASQFHGATYLGNAVNALGQPYDRLIVITDEQAHDNVPAPHGRGYMVNVASFKNGVGYGKWIHIDGWSESVVEYIRELEQLPLA